MTKFEAEYVPLPIIDLGLRFLYRFTSPIETVWVEGRVSVLNGTELTDERIDRYLREEWIKMITESNEGSGRRIPKFLESPRSIKLYKCAIERE